MNMGSAKLELFPDAEQAAVIDKTLDCCLMLWNRMIIDEAKLQAEFGRRYIPAPAKYKRELPELKEADSLALGGIHHMLLAMFRAHDYTPRDYPKPGIREHLESYTTYSQAIKSGYTIRVENDRILLPKVGFVPIGQYEDPVTNAHIKSANVAKSNGKYFCTVKYETGSAMTAPTEIEKQSA